jgi:fructuronate reductase
MHPKLDMSRFGQGAAAWPDYDPRTIGVGIVHLGVSAFHRAHQAVYVDALLGQDPRWGIAGASLKTARVRDLLRAQDGLYTLAVQQEDAPLRVIGALREILAGAEDRAALAERLAAPATRVVSLTVTEAGYCLWPDNALDFAHPDIRADLEGAPVSAIGWIVEGLRRRRQAGLMPFATLSCDNLSRNGALLKAAVVALAARRDAELGRWIEGEARFPNTMVDSITPKTDDALIARVEAQLGARDAAPVQREPFTQWVIEDEARADAPDWEAAGVTLTTDVAPFARAKLRLLNGSHSALAYLGLLAGFATVAEAMAAPWLDRFINVLMRDSAATLAPAKGLDLPAYAAAVRQRFRNPVIRHALAQIAMDGSQKLPIRIVDTVRDRLAAGAPVDAHCWAAAAWLRFVRRQARSGATIVDPLADALAAFGRAMTDDAAHDVDAALRMTSVFPSDIAAAPAVRTALLKAYAALCEGEARGDVPSAVVSRWPG